jgi:hypothetical protein
MVSHRAKKILYMLRENGGMRRATQAKDRKINNDGGLPSTTMTLN